MFTLLPPRISLKRDAAVSKEVVAELNASGKKLTKAEKDERCVSRKLDICLWHPPSHTRAQVTHMHTQPTYSYHSLPSVHPILKHHACSHPHTHTRTHTHTHIHALSHTPTTPLPLFLLRSTTVHAHTQDLMEEE